MHYIRFAVVAQVDLPEDADKETVDRLALSCVTQMHEVANGIRQDEDGSHPTNWVPVYAETSDSDIMERWFE